MISISYFHLSNLHYVAMLMVALIMSICIQAQVETHPLFMQIKTPSLESYSGVQIDPYGNTYHINSANKDSIDISFLIVVPKEMLSEKWAISLTPNIYSSYENGRLKDVVVKGWKFAEIQEEGYEKYDDFVNSIIDSSAYEKMYIDQKRLESEIEHRHDIYWQFYYDEWERQIEYEIWKAAQDGSIQIYSLKEQEIYSKQLRDQYLLRIDNQSRRYIKAGMDTTGLYAKYMREYEIHNAKMPRYFVNENISLKKVPKRYRDIFQSNRSLQDITDSMLELLVKRDSALMALPVLDYQRIVENERKSIRQSNIHEELIQLPRNENALLDTIIYDIRTDYRYLYTYRYPVPESGKDSIKVQLKCKILATDGSGFSSNSEDVLIYTVSPLVYSKPLSRPRELENASQHNPNAKKKETKSEFLEKESEKEFLKKLSNKLNEINNKEEIYLE